ncbi:MAG: AAA domain-containing protein, partial [Ghiorsea sp.]|nr:AAA domain-containing protein [Ghiorsea sp.]
KEKEKERKSFLEQANAYQKAQREVFEKKRFTPFMVKIKINRGKQELVCTLQNDLTITEDYFPAPESQSNISKQLKAWGIDAKGSCEQQLNNFIKKKQVYSNWLKPLMQPLERSAFPDVKKVALSQHVREENRQEKALSILLHLFKSDLRRPKENTFLPEQGCEIGFFETDPSRCKRHEQPSPILYGELTRKDASRRSITLKYESAKQQQKINDNGVGWIGHFSIREESQLKKQEDALKALEQNKGVQEKLLETLAKVEFLQPRNHEAMILDNYISEELDDNQRKAVAKCVMLESGQVAVLQGPPGTGKTTVITEIVQQILKHHPKAKILVASQSHQAVDNVLEKICDEVRVVRLGDDARLKGKAKEYSYTQIAKTMLDNIKKAVQQEACYLDEKTLDSVSSEELSQLEILRADWVKRLSGRDSELESLLFKSVQVVFGTLVG